MWCDMGVWCDLVCVDVRWGAGGVDGDASGVLGPPAVQAGGVEQLEFERMGVVAREWMM